MLPPRPTRAPMLPRLLSVFLAALVAVPAAAQGLWRDLPEGALARTAGAERALPAAYRALALDRAGMAALLATAPPEARPGSLQGAVAVPLPLPDGDVADFLLVEAPILAPGLQARHPALRTYVGARADDPRTTARVSLTPRGLGAWIMAPEGVRIVDPAPEADAGASGAAHLAYRRADAVPPEGWAEARAAEAVVMASGEEHEAAARGKGGGVAHGETLRLYRLAVGATGEYTEFHGGTVEDALEAIVVAMARVNGIYEREAAVRMLLVEGNDAVIFTDALFDPYTDGSPTALFNENQEVLDERIGDENYDIGHVFSTGGGGLAGFGVVCFSGQKARGVTGLPSPVGDPFYVDYVAHEIGHQFRAGHTFNGTRGACTGGNRSAATAYEPGSGSTIMSYVGICGSHNLQAQSDAYFHTGSLREIWNFVTRGRGSTCGEEEPTGNLPPAVEVPAAFAVPAVTPFTLVGAATDEAPEALSYAWEEVDRGPAGPPPGRAGFSGDPPLFRSFLPGADPARTFPQRDRLFAGLPPAIGEALSETDAALTFRLTVRDNRPGAAAAADAEVVVSVEEAVGPFVVTAPNEGGLEFEPGSEITLAWDVAGSGALGDDGEPDADGVDVETVDVLFSPDNGVTFSPLLLGTPNDGAEVVRLPIVETPEARVLIRATVDARGSGFFDINDVPFALRLGVAAERGASGGASVRGPWPNPAGASGAWLEVTAPTPEAVEVALVDALGRRVRTLYAGPLAAGVPRPVRLETAGLAPGAYVVRVIGAGAGGSRTLTVVR